MFCSILHADAIRCRCWNKSFQKLRWLADIGERHGLSTSIIKCQHWYRMRLTVPFICLSIFQLGWASLPASFCLSAFRLNCGCAGVRKCKNCLIVVPYFFFCFNAKCRHNMLLRLPWPNSKSKRWNDSESSFQRLAQLVPFDFIQEKSEGIFHIHHTSSYHIKLKHLRWCFCLRLVIAYSRFTQFGSIMTLECSFLIKGKR